MHDDNMTKNVIAWMMPDGKSYEWETDVPYTHAVVFLADDAWMIHTTHKSEGAASKELRRYRGTYQGHTSGHGYLFGEARIIEVAK